MSIKAIITGSTGMVGEGVLHESLNHPDVESVLVINRSTCGVEHSKLTEIIHSDFSDFTSIESELSGYTAAFLCMGITSFRASEELYTRITHDMTLALAGTLAKLNPDMTLCYVSGAGTDDTEQGRMMWTRVKGKTENALLKLPFKEAFMFRPALIQPTKGLRNAYLFYKLMNPIIPLLRKLFPKQISSLEEIGLAMIQVAQEGSDKQRIEVLDIVGLAKKQSDKGEL
ncbi:MAG: epimerase [FCB group bacterium]|nr:epimerase [FCB group bacterium]MBL7028405.1 epimerase [Candidatus Neomarinimicrobiota bacterium]MBL7122319.1 epimerase [Candidatus Neomarinimicrobiota bacterium]